jgi:hypothetical protein
MPVTLHLAVTSSKSPGTKSWKLWTIEPDFTFLNETPSLTFLIIPLPWRPSCQLLQPGTPKPWVPGPLLTAKSLPDEKLPFSKRFSLEANFSALPKGSLAAKTASKELGNFIFQLGSLL